MARIGITLLLAVMTAVGPCLCCCMAGLLVAPVSAAPPAPAPAPGDEPVAPCRCCHEKIPEEPAPTDPTPEPGHRCSCDSNQPAIKSPAVFDLSSGSQLAQFLIQLDRAEGALCPCPPEALLLNAPEASPEEADPVPFQEARDLLRALHLLLC